VAKRIRKAERTKIKKKKGRDKQENSFTVLGPFRKEHEKTDRKNQKKKDIKTDIKGNCSQAARRWEGCWRVELVMLHGSWGGGGRLLERKTLKRRKRGRPKSQGKK